MIILHFDDELYSNTAVYLDVEDVVNAVVDLFGVESADQIFAFTNANLIFSGFFFPIA